MAVPLESRHPIVLYTKQGCNACTRAKKALGVVITDETTFTREDGLYSLPVSLDARLSSIVDASDVKCIELSIGASGERGELDSTCFERLVAISGRRTVPVVFIGGQYVGGGDEVEALASSGTLLLRLLLTKFNSTKPDPWHIAATSFLSASLPPSFPTPPSTFTSPNKQKHSTNALTDYSTLYSTCHSLIQSELDPIANAANVSSAIYAAFTSSVTNWVGFYFTRTTAQRRLLILGPFQGKPACKRIPYEEGVCGAAARTKETQRVDDVHSFPGHIACDGASKSEIVVPLLTSEGELLGVLDIDSPHYSSFSSEDAKGLQRIAKLLVESCDWSILLKEVKEVEIKH